MEHLDQSIRVAISGDNIALKRQENKCIKCGQCAYVCNDFACVNSAYDLNKTQSPICIHCGQCIKICPTDALCPREEYLTVAQMLKEKDGKVFVASIAPSVRVAMGDEFGLKAGSFVEGKVVELLRTLGFDYVLDINFSADLTICEEANELVQRIKSGKHLPQFSSCCPAWIKYAEMFYPELLLKLSTCKSPIGMHGAMVKTYFAKTKGIDPNNIVHVIITPCVAKKFEIRRKEFGGDINFCLTTTELASWARKENIDFRSLKSSDFDSPMSKASGGGVIFGNSGGVMEATVRTAYKLITGNSPERLSIAFYPVRGLNSTKEATIKIGDFDLKLAVVYGIVNAKGIIEKIKNGEKYDFIEVMACPGGCIGGGGQPKHIGFEEYYQKSRISALYKRDKKLKCKVSADNDEIVKLYSFLNDNGYDKQKLLHTTYHKRKF